MRNATRPTLSHRKRELYKSFGLFRKRFHEIPGFSANHWFGELLDVLVKDDARYDPRVCFKNILRTKKELRGKSLWVSVADKNPGACFVACNWIKEFAIHKDLMASPRYQVVNMWPSHAAACE